MIGIMDDDNTPYIDITRALYATIAIIYISLYFSTDKAYICFITLEYKHFRLNIFGSVGWVSKKKTKSKGGSVMT